jgi:hypothetical protein
MMLIHDAGSFVKVVRKKMRQGVLSRQPLTMLRLEWRGDFVECDWLMRAPDTWDKVLPEYTIRQHQTLQAMRDALNLRALILESFPAVVSAELRMFRADRNHRLELMMSGRVSRSNEVLDRVSSVVMRAKLCGFNFTLSNGVFEEPLVA